MTLRPFHLAFPVDDLTAARDFYGRIIGCAEGRSADRWVDFDFFGHQIVTHLVARTGTAASTHRSMRQSLREDGAALQWWLKKRHISRAAFGPLGSVYEPCGLPPDQAWPPPCTIQCSAWTGAPAAPGCTERV